jgi:hypothetical protein
VVATANPATSATEHPTLEAATPATPATAVAKVADVAVAAGGSKELSAVQESYRRDVIARLEAHPTISRAFVTRLEGNVLIVALAVRGVGTCELAIPADRFDRNRLADFDTLLRSLEGRT